VAACLVEGPRPRRGQHKFLGWWKDRIDHVENVSTQAKKGYIKTTVKKYKVVVVNPGSGGQPHGGIRTTLRNTSSSGSNRKGMPADWAGKKEEKSPDGARTTQSQPQDPDEPIDSSRRRWGGPDHPSCEREIPILGPPETRMNGVY